jgi:hypothetical protein
MGKGEENDLTLNFLYGYGKLYEVESKASQKSFPPPHWERRGPFAVCYLCRAFIIPPTIVVMTPTTNTAQLK